MKDQDKKIESSKAIIIKGVLDVDTIPFTDEIINLGYQRLMGGAVRPIFDKGDEVVDPEDNSGCESYN